MSLFLQFEWGLCSNLIGGLGKTQELGYYCTKSGAFIGCQAITLAPSLINTRGHTCYVQSFIPRWSRSLQPDLDTAENFVFELAKNFAESLGLRAGLPAERTDLRNYLQKLNGRGEPVPYSVKIQTAVSTS